MITVGQQLGGYTILKRIGGGQMGEVFLAQHRRIARRAAIKTLIPELSAKEAVIERFFKEARNTSQIRNPAIVEILDCDVHEGQAYIIMEFLEGESLGTYLKRAGALEPDMAFLLGVMGATASAVGAAHDVGIMHRDLKPENIYLQLVAPASPTVTVKALDFGISQLSRDDGGPSKTKSGVLLGSPAYMSPEQCRGSGKTDERSDIYSLGCVLYEALCGRPPYTSRSLGDLILAHVSEPVKAPIKLVPDVPPKLNALILKMLAKAPDERPASMKVVTDALRDCARALGIDFEAPLEPLIPVERPVLMAEGAPALAIPAEPSKAQPPAPAYVAPTPPSPPSPSGPAVPAPVAPAFSAPASSAPPSSAPPLSAPAAPAFSPAPVVVPVSPPAEDQRQPAFARPPASAAAPSAPALPQHAAGAVERTLIMTPGTSRDTGDLLNRLKGQAGQTVMMPEDEMQGAPGGKPSPISKGAKGPVAGRAAPDEAPRGMAGGTQVLGAFGNAGSASIDDRPPDDEDQDADEQDQEIRETEPVKPPRVGRVERKARAAMAAAGTPPAGVPANLERPPSSLADFARANQNLIVIAGGAVVLSIAILAILLSRPNKSATTSRRSPPAQAATQPAASSAPDKEATKEPDQPPPTAPVDPGAAPAAKVVPPVEDNVRINLKRVPEGTELSVDGHPTALPILIPRGRDTHQIILRAPDGTERSLDVDGTRDRLIELAAPHPSTAPPPHAPAPKVPPPVRAPASPLPQAPAAAPKAPAAVRAPTPPRQEPPAAAPKAPAAVRPPAPPPKEPPAARVPTAPKPSPSAPSTAAPARPSAAPAAGGATDKKAKPRGSKEREAIIDL